MRRSVEGSSGEWTRFTADPVLGVESLHARFVSHRYERHTHDSYVLASVEDGAPVVTSDHRSFVTPAGSAMVINPGQEHDGRPVDGNGYVYRTLYIAPPVMAEVAEAITGDARLVDFADPVTADPRVVAAVRGLHRSLTSEDRLEREVRLLQLLELLVSSHSGRRLRSAGERVEPRIASVRDAVQGRYAESLTTEDLAGLAGLNRVRLNQLFQRSYGLPLHAYLNGVRLRHARRLLAEGVPAAGVAVAVGFGDQSHLSRRFRGSFGITPGQFVAGHASGVQDAELERGR